MTGWKEVRSPCCPHSCPGKPTYAPGNQLGWQLGSNKRCAAACPAQRCDPPHAANRRKFPKERPEWGEELAAQLTVVELLFKVHLGCC